MKPVIIEGIKLPSFALNPPDGFTAATLETKIEKGWVFMTETESGEIDGDSVFPVKKDQDATLGEYIKSNCYPNGLTNIRTPRFWLFKENAKARITRGMAKVEPLPLP
jgi:hypothetical protein